MQNGLNLLNLLYGIRLILNRRVMNGGQPKRGDYNIFWTREQLAQWWEEEKGIVPPEPKIRRQAPKPTREERERLRKLESSNREVS